MAYQSYTILTRKTPVYFWYKCPQCGKTLTGTKEIISKASYDNLHAGWGKAAERRLSERENASVESVNSTHKKTVSDIMTMAKKRQYEKLELSTACPVCKYRLPWQKQNHKWINGIKGLLIFAAVMLVGFAGCMLVEGGASNADVLVKMILLPAGVAAALFLASRYLLPWVRKKLQDKLNAECLQLDESCLPHLFLKKEEMEADARIHIA